MNRYLCMSFFVLFFNQLMFVSSNGSDTPSFIGALEGSETPVHSPKALPAKNNSPLQDSPTEEQSSTPRNKSTRPANPKTSPSKFMPVHAVGLKGKLIVDSDDEGPVTRKSRPRTEEQILRDREMEELYLKNELENFLKEEEKERQKVNRDRTVEFEVMRMDHKREESFIEQEMERIIFRMNTINADIVRAEQRVLDLAQELRAAKNSVYRLQDEKKALGKKYERYVEPQSKPSSRNVSPSRLFDW